MISIAAVAAELQAAGVTGDALVTALRRIEESSLTSEQLREPLRVTGVTPAALRMQKMRKKRALEREQASEQLREQSVTRDGVSISNTISNAKQVLEEDKNRQSDAREVLRVTPSVTPPEITEAVEVWNQTAEELGLAKVQRLTDQRKSALKARLRDCGGIAGWHDAMEKIKASPFLTGQNSNGWHCDFDFVLKAQKFTKIMEGGFNGHNPRAAPNSIEDSIEKAIAFRRWEEARDRGESSDEDNPLLSGLPENAARLCR